MSTYLKITFFNLATLTLDLDLQTHPRYCHCLHSYQILDLYVKQFSLESANGQTHRRDRFYTLSRRIILFKMKFKLDFAALDCQFNLKL